MLREVWLTCKSDFSYLRQSFILLVVLLLPDYSLPHTIEKFVVDLLNLVYVSYFSGKFRSNRLLKVPLLVGFFYCSNRVLLFNWCCTAIHKWMLLCSGMVELYVLFLGRSWVLCAFNLHFNKRDMESWDTCFKLLCLFWAQVPLLVFRSVSISCSWLIQYRSPFQISIKLGTSRLFHCLEVQWIVNDFVEFSGI